jgi:hypothetical protein
VTDKTSPFRERLKRFRWLQNEPVSFMQRYF